MSDEPEYLRRMRESREARRRSASAPRAAAPASELRTDEQEAVRWARETTKAEPRSVRNLAGARYAILLKVAGASGTSSYSLEGAPSKEALAERVKGATTMGDEVAGAYDVKGGRPLVISMEGGEPAFKAGPPRTAAQKVDPQRMLRQATAQAEERARQRPADRDDRGRGGRR
jgi:hypothetical protein